MYTFVYFAVPLLFVTLIVPLSAHAVSAPTDLRDLIILLTGIINLIIPIIFVLTFLTIMWGLIKAWILGAGSSEEIDKGKKIATVGIVALVVMSSIWGILAVLQNSFFR